MRSRYAFVAIALAACARKPSLEISADYALALYSLAEIDAEAGRLADALPLAKEATQVLEVVRGREHPDATTARALYERVLSASSGSRSPSR